MKLFSTYFISILILASLVAATRKQLPDSKATIELHFNTVVGNEKLVLDKSYQTKSGEEFRVSSLQYFISNIRLTGAGGKEIVIEQDSSYFLVDQNIPSTSVMKISIPPGKYERISFIIGVDSLRNTMPISRRTGVLDPANAMDNGMYWGWNSGYIFFKMEGLSQQAPVDPTGRRKFRYHIGGFGGYSAPTINNIKSISIDLAGKGVIDAGPNKISSIFLNANLLKLFDGDTSISIKDHPSVMFSDYSVNVSRNYSKMFYHDHTTNQ